MSDDLTKKKRAELDKLAAAEGVPNPASLPNKDAVVEAIEAPNPALVPEPPPPPGPCEYRVTGAQRVLDHDPGETFTATLPSEQERFLLDGGHLAKTKEKN